ncbi:MAG: hypothetical protein PHD81_01775 [Candidatus Nanoarchaeia archaeon]|nr:hypothetical protein [Candidatus Nanoarchaeia archaeon]MDD5587818.1 hypothetical protein [Candidatus Nanoarchaeia archaeon]
MAIKDIHKILYPSAKLFNQFSAQNLKLFDSILKLVEPNPVSELKIKMQEEKTEQMYALEIERQTFLCNIVVKLLQVELNRWKSGINLSYVPGNVKYTNSDRKSIITLSNPPYHAQSTTSPGSPPSITLDTPGVERIFSSEFKDSFKGKISYIFRDRDVITPDLQLSTQMEGRIADIGDVKLIKAVYGSLEKALETYFNPLGEGKYKYTQP